MKLLKSMIVCKTDERRRPFEKNTVGLRHIEFTRLLRQTHLILKFDLCIGHIR